MRIATWLFEQVAEDATFQRLIRINDELVNLLQLAETKGDLETESRLHADYGDILTCDDRDCREEIITVRHVIESGVSGERVAIR